MHRLVRPGSVLVRPPRCSRSRSSHFLCRGKELPLQSLEHNKPSARLSFDQPRQRRTSESRPRLTLEPVLVEVSSSGDCHTKGRSNRARQNHAGLRAQLPPGIHKDVDGPSRLRLVTEVKRSAHQQVAPAAGRTTRSSKDTNRCSRSRKRFLLSRWS